MYASFHISLSQFFSHIDFKMHVPVATVTNYLIFFNLKKTLIRNSNLYAKKWIFLIFLKPLIPVHYGERNQCHTSLFVCVFFILFKWKFNLAMSCTVRWNLSASILDD